MGEKKSCVPQGSVLGPLSFLYITDMKAVYECNLFLYADDSTLLLSHRDTNEVQKVGEGLNKLGAWLSENTFSTFRQKQVDIIGFKTQVTQNIGYQG